MARNAPPSEAIQKISVVRTLQASYAIVFGNLRAFLRAAALPLFLTWVLGIITATAQTFSTTAALFLLLVALIPHVLFAVAWNRFSLLGPVDGAPELFPRWQLRHWRYLGILFKIAAIQLLVIFLLSSVSSQLLLGSSGDLESGVDPATLTITSIPATFIFLGLLPTFFVAVYLYFRWSFAFPATAVDEDYGLSHAWRHTKGQGLRILAAAIAAGGPLGLIVYVISWLLFSSFEARIGIEETGEKSLPWALFLLELLLLKPLQFLTLALWITAIAEAFRVATGWIADDHRQPPTTIDLEV